MPRPQVEQYFIKAGYLLPTFHQNYWLGLTVRGACQAGPRCHCVAILLPAQRLWQVSHKAAT